MITNSPEQVQQLISAEARLAYPELFKASYATATAAYSPIYPSAELCAPFDVHCIREAFPILRDKVNGKQLIWLDNAATTQKPKCVIDRISCFYAHENSNVHRAAHTLARTTTEAYEGARSKIAEFVGATSPDTLVFVRGATEGINLVAQSYGSAMLTEGDEILISELEHHANIVPWQLLCKNTGAILRCFPIDDSGQISLTDYAKLLSQKTKIVSISHVSNVLGTITPLDEIIGLAHKVGAKVLVDGAQAVSHLPVNVTALDCDFYTFSGHKLFGPTGVGVLYGKSELLDQMKPYQGGGNMISSVTLSESLYKSPPHRFEAGTGSIGDALGLGCAVSYVMQIGFPAITSHEHALLEYATESLSTVPGLIIYGNAKLKTGIISFSVNGFDSDNLAELLDREGIAVRAGHHCSQPVLNRFGLSSVVRASFALYNTLEEIDILCTVLRDGVCSNMSIPYYSFNSMPYLMNTNN